MRATRNLVGLLLSLAIIQWGWAAPPASAVSYPPTAVAASWITSVTMSVTWAPPSSLPSGVRVSYYDVNVISGDDVEYHSCTRSAAPLQCSFYAPTVKTWMTHEVMVVANLSNGSKQVAEPFVIVPTAYDNYEHLEPPVFTPTNATATAGDTTALVSWTAPAIYDPSPVNGYLYPTSYTVRVYDAYNNDLGPGCTTRAVNNKLAPTQCTVRNLANGRSRYFKVKPNSINASIQASAAMAATASTNLVTPRSPTQLRELLAKFTPGNVFDSVSDDWPAESLIWPVSGSFSEVKVTPTLADPTSTVTVNGTPVASGSMSGPISVPVGSSTVTIVVTTADQSDSRTYTLTLNRPKADQAITFNQPPNVSIAQREISLTPTATSGLPVTLSTTTSSVCTAAFSTETTTRVTLVAPGTCTLKATQAGDGVWGPAAEVTRGFTVNKRGQAITFTQPADSTLGDGGAPREVPLAVTAGSGLAPALTSNSPAVCTVTGTTATLTAEGMCSLTANQAGDATWSAAAAVTRTFAVGPGRSAQTISFDDPPDLELAAGPFTLAPTATSGLPVILESTDPDVCTTSGLTVTPITPGDCTLAATQAGDASYAPAPPVIQTFTVTRSTQTIDFPQPADIEISDGPVDLVVTASSGLAVDLSSDTPNTCTLIGMRVVPLAAGDCTLMAAQGGDSDWKTAQQKSRTLEVKRSDQTITFINPGDNTLSGPARPLDASASSGLPVSVSSLTPTVCTVAGGKVDPAQAGTCNLRATQAGDDTWLAAPAEEVSFEVFGDSQEIEFDQPGGTALQTGLVPLKATATSGLPVIITSQTPAVCAVSGSSTLLLSAGNCSIAATQPGDATWAAATQVTRGFTVSRNPQTIQFTLPGTAQAPATLGLAVTASSGLPVALTAEPAEVCAMVSGRLVVTTAGECRLTAVQDGDAAWDPAPTVNATVSVLGVTDPPPADPPADPPMNAGPSDGAPGTAASPSAPVIPHAPLTGDHGAAFVTAGTMTYPRVQLSPEAGRIRYSGAKRTVALTVQDRHGRVVPQGNDLAVAPPRARLTLSGTGMAPGSSVQVWQLPGKLLASATADSNGSYTVHLGRLAGTRRTITVQVAGLDGAGTPAASTIRVRVRAGVSASTSVRGTTVLVRLSPRCRSQVTVVGLADGKWRATDASVQVQRWARFQLRDGRYRLAVTPLCDRAGVTTKTFRIGG